jgi:hypothetical protein
MPTIETYRNQAKLLLRWHREGDYSVGGRVRGLERYQTLTDREVLALKFTPTRAQEIVAVETGYRSWAELKAATAVRAFLSLHTGEIEGLRRSSSASLRVAEFALRQYRRNPSVVIVYDSA